MDILGRLVEASNATFLVEVNGAHAVYKPVRGEAPLWDFPTGTLGRREVAAHELSRAVGFDTVPRTIWVDDAPLGSGSLQDWVEVDGDDLVGLVGMDEIPEGWHPVVVGVDEDEREVALVHADHPGLRRLALFDAVVNNADRKAGHVLRVGERVLGVDHGVCFHEESKLRTVLWGWAGMPLEPHERELLQRTVAMAPEVLAAWLSPSEVEATVARARILLERGSLPQPGDRWPAIPWPPI